MPTKPASTIQRKLRPIGREIPIEKVTKNAEGYDWFWFIALRIVRRSFALETRVQNGDMADSVRSWITLDRARIGCNQECCLQKACYACGCYARAFGWFARLSTGR